MREKLIFFFFRNLDFIFRSYSRGSRILEDRVFTSRRLNQHVLSVSHYESFSKDVFANFSTTFDSRVSRTRSACISSTWRAFWERCRLSNLSKDTNTLDERLEINYAEGIITARRIEWASRFVEQCLSTLGKLSSLWAVRRARIVGVPF